MALVRGGVWFATTKSPCKNRGRLPTAEIRGGRMCSVNRRCCVAERDAQFIRGPIDSVQNGPFSRRILGNANGWESHVRSLGRRISRCPFAVEFPEKDPNYKMD
jgi:hypothetical protein